MKRIEKVLEDCISTPSSCVIWDGIDISFLGICQGDELNCMMQDIIKELQSLTEEDLSSFDINSLLKICNQKALDNKTLISILTLLKENHICLKKFIDELNTQLNKLLQGTNISVNLKCYNGFNGLGLSITKDIISAMNGTIDFTSEKNKGTVFNISIPTKNEPAG